MLVVSAICHRVVASSRTGMGYRARSVRAPSPNDTPPFVRRCSRTQKSPCTCPVLHGSGSRRGGGALLWKSGGRETHIKYGLRPG